LAIDGRKDDMRMRSYKRRFNRYGCFPVMVAVFMDQERVRAWEKIIGENAALENTDERMNRGSGYR